MIISTAGSRVIKRDRNEVRRKTLLDIAKGEDVHDSRNEVITRRRTVSDVDPVAAGNIKMDDIGVKKKKTNDEKPKPTIVLRDFPPRVQEGVCTLLEEDFQTAWINIVSERDVNQITATQRQALRKFEETNEMLRHFNLLSESTFIGLQKEYQSHVLLLGNLKNDLEQIFRRLRSLKEKIKEKYPEAVQATVKTVKMLKERQMMEIECEMQKYNSMDESNALTDQPPEYVINPDTLDDKRSSVNFDNRSSAVELEENKALVGNLEINLIQRDYQKENESSEMKFLVMSMNSDLPINSKADDYEKQEELMFAHKENMGLDGLKTNVTSKAEFLEDSELPEDLKNDFHVVAQKINELEIKSEGIEEGQSVENDTKKDCSAESSDLCDNGTDIQLATKENVDESELEIINNLNDD